MDNPKVIVVDETKQTFNGESFYLCGNYYQHKGKRLHRVVWEYYNGEIPKGYHVHHIDADRSNNNIENLQCIPGVKHVCDHGHTPERLEYGRMHIKRIRPKASEWHRSEAGRAWHSEMAKRNNANRTYQTYVCTQCGQEFQSKRIYPKDSNRFCGNNCRAKYGRAHKKKTS